MNVEQAKQKIRKREKWLHGVVAGVQGSADIADALRKMQEYDGHSDEPHMKADGLLLKRLRELGEEEVVEAYVALKKATGFLYY